MILCHKAQSGLEGCYDLKSLEWDKRTNSYIRVNTRELDREFFTKQSTLYTPTDGPY